MGRVAGQVRCARRVLLLQNPRARRGSEGGIVAETLRELGARVLEPASHPWEGLLQACDVVVVAGGDGSIHRVVQRLVHRPVPLGVIPLGTANDLAHSLGIPHDPVDACHVIAAGVEKRIDVGQACGRYFLNAAGLGLSAAVTRRLTQERDLKRRWGVLGYARASLDALRAARPFTLVLDGPSGRCEFPSIQLVIGNGRYHGGGLTIDERAEIDEGRLRLYSLDPMGLWNVARLLPALWSGRQARRPGIRSATATRFFVETRPRKAIHADGEWIGTTPAEFRVVPHALTVLVPPDETRS